jgi:phosphate transport system permease protein
MTWLTAGALATNVLLVVGLLALIALRGLAHFWQPQLVELELRDGTRLLGAEVEREARPGDAELRVRMALGNRDLTGSDFRWVDEDEVVGRELPRDAGLIERLEWGRFYGFPVELRRGEQQLATGGAVWEALPPRVKAQAEVRRAIAALQRREIDPLNRELGRLGLRERALRREGVAAGAAELARLQAARSDYQARYEEQVARLRALEQRLGDETLVMRTADGVHKEIAVGHIVRAVAVNRLDTGGRVRLYASRLVEFLCDEPRESNTEGGIFPALFGTVLMVFLTSAAVAPLGVLAAVYLREYAREGAGVRVVRIAVNSLAGVPSIVFGVFGLGFFVYLVGGTIDQLFYPERLPTPTFGTGGILWASLTLALLTVPVVIVSTEEGLAAVPRVVREGSLALGATRYETLRRVVLPAAVPGVLTGLILAMARAAGEVAPLMIVGMVKLAPALPVDGQFPFVHLERKFMHLGFHIYDVGFQSPNVEAVQPLVFATALLLILLVLFTNLTAILLRNRLRRRYAASGV